MEDKGIITSFRILEKDPEYDNVMGLEGRVMELLGIAQLEREMRIEVVRPDDGVEKTELERMCERNDNSVWIKEPFTMAFRFLMELNSENAGLVMDSDRLNMSVECIRDARYRVEFRNEKGGGLTTGGKYDAVICSRDKESGLTTYLAKGMANQYAPTKGEDYDYPIGAWFAFNQHGEENNGSDEYPIGHFEMNT